MSTRGPALHALGWTADSFYVGIGEARDPALQLVVNVCGELPEAVGRESAELLAGLVAFGMERAFGRKRGRNTTTRSFTIFLPSKKLIVYVCAQLVELCG